MIVSVVLLILGFALLIKGSDILVDGASNVAKKFNIPTIIIGLTIVLMLFYDKVFSTHSL